MIKIALAGNPNVGKTSLFNRITHSLEHVGNWHGVTVEKKEKTTLYDHKQITVRDLPGLYSLTPYSLEETVSRDCLLSGENDLVICICEVNNLARNLYLALQLLELDVPFVLAVNMMDELKRQGKVFNYRKLENYLKVPIVPISARYHSDVHLLMDVALEHIKDSQNRVSLKYLENLPLEQVKEIIGGNVKQAGFKLRYAAIKVLERDKFVIEKLNLSGEQRGQIDSLGDWQPALAAARYRYIDEITEGAIVKVVDEHHEMHEHAEHGVPLENSAAQADQSVSEKHKRHHDEHSQRHGFMAGVSKLDRIMLNKYLALPIFLCIMLAIFAVTFGLIGVPLSDLLGLGIEKFIYTPIIGWLGDIKTPLWLQSLVGDGIINGLGGVIVFLPQITLLFLFLAFLEDTGYISRVAFMTDGIFRKIGLSGRSVFTMLMGFGCSATAILTARGLEDEKMRKKTVILTPFMSCSARLPIYSAIAGAFFRLSPLIIFALYVIGVVVTIGFAALFQKIRRLRSGKLSFIMEMPPYRTPGAQRVFQLIWHNIKVFLIRVGTVVFALNIIVWILSSFSLAPGGGFVQLGTDGPKSIMETIAGFIAPVFRPLGFGNWQAVTALLSGLVAKELVITTMGSLGGVETALSAGDAAFSFLVFTLLYCPCIATLAAIRKEAGFKWTLFGFGLQMGTAYLAALLFRGLWLLFAVHTAVAVTVTITLVVGLLVALALVKAVKNRGRCAGCAGCNSCDECGKNQRCGKNGEDDEA